MGSESSNSDSNSLKLFISYKIKKFFEIKI